MSSRGPNPLVGAPASEEGEGEEEEEEFKDAESSFPPVSEHREVDPVAGMATVRAAIDMSLNNKFFEAEALLKPWIRSSMYHAVAHSTIVVLQAVMSLERDNIEQATVALNDAITLCNAQRKNRGIMESISGWMFGQRMDGYTLLEIHAELFSAEGNLLLSVLTFLQDENLLSFIKGGLRIRSCFSLYKQLYGWLETCRQEGQEVDPDFAAGVSMGIGCFNLIISILPARILRLLEFVGFSGNRELGLKELLAGATSTTPRAPLCTLSLLTYHTVGVVLLGSGDVNPDLAEELLSPHLLKYPTSVQFLYFKGRVELMRGNVDEAIGWFTRSLTAQDQWATVHHLCWWELMWCHALKLEWPIAADYADKLYQDSQWSKTVFLYQKASFVLMQRDLSPASQGGGASQVAPGYSRSEVEEMMRLIPTYKQRIAGKSLPSEKLAIAKAERYLAGNWIPLSALELMYVWNSFVLLAKSPPLLKKLLQCTRDEIARLEQTKDENSCYYDDWCVSTLLQAVCLRHLGHSDEAESRLRAVIQRYPSLQHDQLTGPAACLELACLCIASGRIEEAERLLETSKSTYKGYHMESRIHFRMHSALRKIAQLKAASTRES